MELPGIGERDIMDVGVESKTLLTSVSLPPNERLTFLVHQPFLTLLYHAIPVSIDLFLVPDGMPRYTVGSSPIIPPRIQANEVKFRNLINWNSYSNVALRLLKRIKMTLRILSGSC